MVMRALAMAERAIILIPDISGFTGFTGATGIDHHVITELLELIVASNETDFTLAEIEGDAARWGTWLFQRHGRAAKLVVQTGADRVEGIVCALDNGNKDSTATSILAYVATERHTDWIVPSQIDKLILGLERPSLIDLILPSAADRVSGCHCVLVERNNHLLCGGTEQ